ncbi:MAG: O-antigen ligase family protein [Nitrospirae bacterium]|nr:O-antigen ligase family protein [Nitrospirota bacterium]
MSVHPDSDTVARWLPRLDGALEASVLAFFFLLPFPHTGGARDAVLAAALALWVIKTRVFGQPVRGAGLGFNWIIAAYAGFVLFATVISVDPVISVKALRGDLSKFLLAYILVVEAVRTPRQIRRLFGTSVLASTVVVALGFAGGWTREQTGGLAMSLPLFQNPNIIAAYLVLPTIMLVGLMVAAREVPRKLLWGGLLAAHAAMLLATGSRTAVAATVIALAVFSAVLTQRMKVLGAGVLVLVLAAGVTHDRAPSVFARYLSLFESATYDRGGLDQTMAVRWRIWSETFDLAKEHPWAGYGYGGNLFPKVFQRSNNGVYQQLGSPVHAHNVWLQALFETGTTGLVLFAAVLGSAMWMLLAALRHNRAWDERVVAAIAVGGLIGIVVHSMTEGLYGSGMFGVLLWGLIGAAVSARSALQSPRESATASSLIGVPTTPFPPCHGTEESDIRGA